MTGLLAQDAGQVAVVFSSAAGVGSAVGSYAIAAALTGPAAGNYTLALAPGNGLVTITPGGDDGGAERGGEWAGGGGAGDADRAGDESTSGVPTGTVVLLDGGALIAERDAVGERGGGVQRELFDGGDARR